MQKVTGYTAEEICRPGAWRTRIHSEDVLGFDAEVQRMRSDREAGLDPVYDQEYRVQRKDGEWIWVNAKGTGAYEIDGARYIDGVLTDITQRKRLEQELIYEATRDSLTGLPNRQLFDERFEEALQSARHCNGKMALLMLDLDRFERINGAFRRVGDNLLRRAAQRLNGGLRESETLARVGGDEFMLIIPEPDNTQLPQRIAENSGFPCHAIPGGR